MKKYLALLLAVLMLAAVFAGCASKETTTDAPADIPVKKPTSRFGRVEHMLTAARA